MIVNAEFYFIPNWREQWTQDGKDKFKGRFKAQIEKIWSGSNVRLYPNSKECPCADKGFKPKMLVNTSEGGTTATKGTMHFDVRSYIARSESEQIDDGDLDPLPLEGGLSPHVGAAHEVGHRLGLSHPGWSLWRALGAANNNEGAYMKVGKDWWGHDVNGPDDLMGKGGGMRPFYFDQWGKKLNENYKNCCEYAPRN